MKQKYRTLDYFIFCDDAEGRMAIGIPFEDTKGNLKFMEYHQPTMGM